MHMSTIFEAPLTLMVSSPTTSGHRLASPVPFTWVYESASSVSLVIASDGGAVNRESPAKIANAPVAAFLKLSDAADISMVEVDARGVVAPAIRAPLKAEEGAKASAEGLSAESATAITASFMMIYVIGWRSSTTIREWWWQRETRHGLVEHSRAAVDETGDVASKGGYALKLARMRMDVFTSRETGTFGKNRLPSL